jgi:uncharacterized protein (TIGR00369 family)
MENYKELPNRFGDTCFGCGSKNAAGLRMRFNVVASEVVSELILPERFSGWKNIAHGGVLTTILDEIMSWTAIYLLDRSVVTKNINVDFIKPVFVKEKLRAVGRMVERKKRHSATLEGEIYNESRQLCAKSIAVFAVLPPKVAERMGVR